jgi:hypothetical protein
MRAAAWVIGILATTVGVADSMAHDWSKWTARGGIGFMCVGFFTLWLFHRSDSATRGDEDEDDEDDGHGRPMP